MPWCCHNAPHGVGSKIHSADRNASLSRGSLLRAGIAPHPLIASVHRRCYHRAARHVKDDGFSCLDDDQCGRASAGFLNR
jgi:hypothetical protein